MQKPHWIILAPEQSWDTAFQHEGIWGAKEMLYPEWKALDPGDIIFFYATKTVRGVIGVGRVGTKFIQDKPLWPDEIQESKLIYPLRFEFHVDYLIERNKWRIDKIPIGLTIGEMRRGINLLRQETTQQLYASFATKFNHVIIANDRVEPIQTSQVEVQPPSHSELQRLVFEIGKLNRLISEKEYPMGTERLDVVWRRVEKSVPTYVFEIQVGGDIYHALGKLKHAFDLWNSNIFFVANEDDIKRADDLLAGLFHEISGRITKITFQQVHELYTQKRKWVDLEREIGLL